MEDSVEGFTLPEDRRDFAALVAIIAHLRGPEGCPWDKKQTHLSLRENLLEECYEVLQALDRGEANKLAEELGDLLLQIVLHAQIAREAGEFDIGAVVKSINDKLIRRHPHIFGSQKASTAEEVTHNWEVLKRSERAEGASMLDGVPKEMPALAYSQRVQARVARVGFDWKDTEGVVDKLGEEVRELRGAANREERAREFGDVLFTLVNLARREGIDAESALREANERFYTRFSHMERLCRERGLELNKLSLDEQNALWDEVKRLETKQSG
jgi:tetrapyrrole methylase family protein/MazG family protein